MRNGSSPFKQEQLLQERWNRIQKAVALGRPDRVPVVLQYAGFAAQAIQTPMAEFLSSSTQALQTMIQAYLVIGGGDAINYGMFWPYGLCYDFMSRVLVPGVDLPDDAMWQVDEAVPHLAAETTRKARARGYPAVWVGGWRGAPSLFSPETWNRFVWTYFRRLVHEVIDSGLIALLHLDSDWTRELGRFRELPRGKCIMALDGETDIFEAKRILGDHMCLMGDVPATLLFLNTPCEVSKYCRRLIRELGPEGFILQSGCDIPTNAKLENVQAMVASVGSP